MFHQALSNDFNTPEALAAVNKYLNILFSEIQYNPSYILVSTAYKLIKEYNTVLGVLDKQLAKPPEELENLLDAVINIIVDVRKELRQRKLYDLADRIRSELGKHGIILMDKGKETTWLRK